MDDVSEVLRGLRDLQKEFPADEIGVKIINRGSKSYSIIELVTEIENGTKAGRELARMIAAAAKKDRSAIANYLRHNAQS